MEFYGDEAQRCSDRQGPVVISADRLSGGMTQVNIVVTKMDKVLKSLTDASSKMIVPMGKVVEIAKRIPKVGKLISVGFKVIEGLLKILKMIQPRITNIVNVWSKLTKVMNFLSGTLKAEQAVVSATAGMLKGGSALDKQAIACVAATSSCVDDKTVTESNARFNVTFNAGYNGINACNRAMDSLESIANDILGQVLNFINKNVLAPIAEALDALERALKPVLDAIQKVLDAIAKFATVAYCCNSPYFLGKTVELAGKIFDVATCPVDGVLNTLNSAVTTLVAAVMTQIDKVINLLIAPIVAAAQKLQDINFAYPAISQNFAFDAQSCLLTMPVFSMQKFSPFSDIVDALTIDSTPIGIPELPNLVKEIEKSCNSALNDLTNIDEGSCCRDHVPAIKDGDTCDPTGMGPTRYSCYAMCQSNKHDTRPDLSTRCGVSPPWEDGELCGAGTTCNKCKNGYEYWWSKALTACGSEPRWADGTPCGAGTTCGACKNPSSYWWSKAFTMCGSEPGWADGTVCADGTTCKACKNPFSYWLSKVFTACGREPCWGRGTYCLAGTSCKHCCGGDSWSWSKFGQYCD